MTHAWMTQDSSPAATWTKVACQYWRANASDSFGLVKNNSRVWLDMKNNTSAWKLFQSDERHLEIHQLSFVSLTISMWIVMSSAPCRRSPEGRTNWIYLFQLSIEVHCWRSVTRSHTMHLWERYCNYCRLRLWIFNKLLGEAEGELFVRRRRSERQKGRGPRRGPAALLLSHSSLMELVKVAEAAHTDRTQPHSIVRVCVLARTLQTTCTER